MKMKYLMLFLFLLYSSYLLAHAEHDQAFEKDYYERSQTNILVSSISPDVKYLAYVNAGGKGIFIQDLGNDHLGEIVLYSDYYISPKIYWANDSNMLAFVTDDSYQNSFLIVSDKKGNELYRKDISQKAIDFGWIEHNGVYGLFLDRSDNIIFSKQNNKVHKKSTGDNYSFEYKSNKDEIVFKKNNSPVRTVSGAIYDLTPSPSGRYLAYGDSGNIIIYNHIDDSLINIGSGVEVSWSPNEKKIAYQKSEDNGHYITSAEIYIYDIFNNKGFRLTETKEKIESFPKWKGNDKVYYSYKNDLSVGFSNVKE